MFCQLLLARQRMHVISVHMSASVLESSNMCSEFSSNVTVCLFHPPLLLFLAWRRCFCSQELIKYNYFLVQNFCLFVSLPWNYIQLHAIQLHDTTCACTCTCTCKSYRQKSCIKHTLISLFIWRRTFDTNFTWFCISQGSLTWVMYEKRRRAMLIRKQH